jgi:diphosphomevalonate decarboxylase
MEPVEEDFKASPLTDLKEMMTAQWEAPSNIALVKYWGKRELQLPANPSISFTLSTSKTITSVNASKGDHGFTILYDGVEKPDFAPKIKSYFQRIKDYCPWVTQYHFIIDTVNTFPHSSGIASSASSMAALSSCIMDMESQLTKSALDIHKTSFLARLGSGSACRSVNGEVVVWGTHADFKGSNDYYGLNSSDLIHDNFKSYQDTILLVDKGKKEVSSTLGHELMNGHPFAAARFDQAHTNMTSIKEALTAGDIPAFIKIVESEALTLHAMMMTSHPYFILMKPHTLSIIEEVWAFRKKTGVPVCFTLDAGANVHLLFPKTHKKEVDELVNSKMAQYCDNSAYICDEIGSGAAKL